MLYIYIIYIKSEVPPETNYSQDSQERPVGPGKAGLPMWSKGKASVPGQLGFRGFQLVKLVLNTRFYGKYL